MANEYYQKHIERIRKQGRKKYENLSKEEKEKKASTSS